MSFRKRNSLGDDTSSSRKNGWMSQSQSLAMSLMDNDYAAEKRPSLADDEVDRPNTRTVYRLVDRESKFNQAKYPLFVQRVLPLDEVFNLFYAKDPVLALTNLSTLKGFVVMLLFFIVSCAITALPWYAMGRSESYREDCSIETTGFQRAFIFSSQVIMTIGFGTKDIFFGNCIVPTIVLTFHCGVSLLVQSIIMGIIYQRLSRATSRRHTVVYSNNAVIRRIRGKLYFMLQVSELRAMQLVEAHVRLYMVRHESVGRSTGDSLIGIGMNNMEDEDALFTQTYAMRLSQPNDDLGSKILLSTPQIIVHEIDEHSPLRPPAVWKEERRNVSVLPPLVAAIRPSVALGGIMSESDSNPRASIFRTGTVPSVDTTDESRRTEHSNDGQFPCNNYQFPEIIQNKSRTTPSTNHSDEKSPHDDSGLAFEAEKLDIEKFMRDKNAEIVVVIEGVDPMTSHNVQSYHSYICEEIKWDHFFVRCCSVVNGWTTVDFTKFHFLKPVSRNENNAAGIPSHN